MLEPAKISYNQPHVILISFRSLVHFSTYYFEAFEVEKGYLSFWKQFICQRGPNLFRFTSTFQQILIGVVNYQKFSYCLIPVPKKL